MKAMLDPGKGSGPLNHMWNIYKEEGGEPLYSGSCLIKDQPFEIC